MNTISIILSILATITSAFTLITVLARNSEIDASLYNLEDGLRECANRTTLNKLDISTIDNRTKAKPKAKRGRPRKDGK